jgi:membrane protease subunit (stomatin/prohibitin family)
MFGFMGAVARYQAGEIAPVGKDTFNYMAHGTQGGVRTMASAVGAGLAEGAGGATLACPACGHPNDEDAKFCDDCGAAVSKACPTCGAANDGHAKFCDGCGNRLATNE